MPEKTQTIKRTLVEPRLKGLLVQSPSQDGQEPGHTLHPWTQVAVVRGSNSQHWHVYDPDGRRLRQGRRAIRLKIRDRSVACLAVRLQARAFKQSWDRGDFRLAAQYSFPWAGPIGLASSLLLRLACIIIPGTALLRLWAEQRRPGSAINHMEPFSQALLWGVLWTIMLCGPAFLSWSVPKWFRVIRKPRWRESRIDNDGISTGDRDGNELFARWANLADFRWHPLQLVCLRFHTGTEI